MNQTQTRSLRKKVLSLILAVVMAVSLLPISAFASGDSKASTTASTDEFVRIFHLDCGRKYFSVSEIEGIIDQLAENHYTHLQLAFGNDGLRFLLNDMSVTVNGTEYASEKVTSAIKQGNKNLTSGSSGELSESEMDAIVSYANNKGIQIIPLFNAPGHMYTVVNAMNTLGVGGKYIQVSNLSDGRTSNWAVDPTDSTAVAFAEALLQKYVTYFAEKGSTMFNIGADESGLSTDNYAAYADMVNGMNAIVKKAGMTTLAYNDGIYNTAYAASQTDVKFDNDIIICYWTSGANSASVADFLNKKFKILNNSDNWYYVLGDYLKKIWADGQWGYDDALNGIKSTPVTQMKNYTGTEKPIGSVLCVWSDAPGQTYESSKVYALIKAMADANPEYFKDTTPAVVPGEGGTVQPTKQADGTYNVSAAESDTVQLTLSNITAEHVLWSTSDDTIATVTNGVVTFTGKTGKVTITAEPLSAANDTETVTYSVTFTVSEKVAVAEERTIELTVGETKSDTFKGGNYAGTYTTEDPAVATVAVTGTDEKSESYSEKTVKASSLGSSSSWQKTSYFYQGDDGEYYSVYGKYSSSGKQRTYYWGYSKTNSANDVTVVDSTTDRNKSVTVYTKNNTATPATTTVTATGRSVGTTYVTVGTVRYTIVVSKENLDNAATLPIQLWITNVSIEVTDVTTKGSGQFNDYNNGGYAQYVTVKADAANNCEEGVPLSDIVPVAVKDKSATTKDDRTAAYALWKGTVLNTTTGLQKYWWKDMTMADGRTDYQYVRYYGGKWAVSADRKNWTNVTGDGSTGSSSNCKEQVIAYYMQRTDVTKEVITDVVDWGNVTDKWASGKPTQYSVLDFAVKYPDGTQVPNKFPADGKTVYFHCNEDDKTGVVHQDNNDNYYRRIGLINGIDTTGYEIYMITVTPTSDVVTDQLTDENTALTTDTKIEYKGTEKVAWVDDESNLPKQFQSVDAKFTSISGTFNYTVGGSPNIAGLEIYQRQGMLVTYYIRPIVTADSLHVYYVDDTTKEQFYEYAINVNSLYSGDMKFKEGIALARPNWKGFLVDGDVQNDYNVTQTVSADLSTMPAIDAKYRYAVGYTCVRIKRSDDGKSVTLYYTFKTDKTFVVDFGLPLVIQPTDISANLESATLKGVTAKSSTKQDYAEISTSNTDYSITYKLKTMLNGADKLDVEYSGEIPVDDGTQTGSVSYEVGIIPATTVYYEDSFVEFSDGWEYATTTDQDAVQDLDELTAQKTYGYDSHYTTSNEFSLGNARMTTVSSETNSNPPTAKFTFKGTGFDLVSMTSKDTGTILVNVVGKDSAGNDVKENWIVDTFYGYTRTQEGYIQYTWTLDKDGKTWHNTAVKIPALPEGAKTGGTPSNDNKVTYEPNYIWTAVTDQSNALYQIPVIHYTDLPYGTYTVKITPKYSSARDPYYTADGDNSYDFYLDGVRIYNPAGDTLNDQYVKDHEGYAQFTEIRDMLLSASSLKADIEPTTGMVFVDGVGDQGKLTDYTNYGPNNEVYLSKGQAIAFKISDMSNVDTIQIGAKAPSGNTTMQIKVYGNDVQTQELTTASDMYYKLSNVEADKTIVITNTGDNLLSLTTLKVTYKTTPTATNSTEAIVDSDVLAQAPVMLTSMLYGEPQTFEPSRFEASWGRSVRAGQKATLTVKASDDVEAIEVNGVTIDTYRTRTERTGWGWWAKRVTYREFTYTVTAEATADYAVYAMNSDGVKSEPTTATLTVKPAINWWHKWF